LGEYEVYLLGNNLSLARCEITSLVQRITDCAEFQWNGRFGAIKSDVNPLPFLRRRAVLTHEVGKVLTEGTNISDVVRDLIKSMFESNDSRKTFAVKVIDVDSSLQSGEKTSLSSTIGSCIQKLTRRPVSLKHPQEVYTLFVMEGKWLLSKSYSTSLCKELQDVRARQYPFFHPSMMNSVLARVMCNIAGVLPSDIVLDPFCGGGGILVEAEKIGARVIGIDRNWRLLSGAKSNLASLKEYHHTLIQSDSRYLPIDDVDRIVTDPPYGKSSSTLGAQSTELVETCIRRVLDWERLQGMCICADSKMNLGRFLQEVGLEEHTRVPIRVHRSLTREVFRVQF
jgi:tRNA (guanine10-N2)-dimethyltransferase